MSNWSTQEQSAFKYLYALADNEEVGVLTGDKAVTFLAKSKLPVETLGEIWQLADKDNHGFLTPERFNVACRLLGHAQNGDIPSETLTNKPSPIPVFEGISIPGVAQSSSAGLHPKVLPHVTTEDKTKFMRLFLNAGPTNGLLEGEKAKDIFLKSNLPFDQLGSIWQLADTQSRGSLDATDFVIGMHLLQLAMTQSLPAAGLPDVLPPSYVEAAAVPISTTTQSTGFGQGSPIGGRATSPPLKQNSILKQHTGERPIARQNTGQRVTFSPMASAVAAPTSPGSRAFPQRASNPAFGPAWEVTPAEKARFDGFFDSLDVGRIGYLEGDKAVPFFLESHLPEAALAQIWDLSDIRKEGRLNKEEFAVAMRLVNDQLDGKPLPTVLPLSMIPTSLRSTLPQATTQTALPSSQQDLFSLMDDPADASIGSAPVSQFSPQSMAMGLPRTMSPQNTGAFEQTPAVSTMSFASRTSAASEDFFADDGASKLSNDAAQLGQLQNELNASSRGVDTLTQQRIEMETTAAAQSCEVTELKERLRVSRETFAREQKLVNELAIKSSDQKKAVTSAREEVITAESELSALKQEKRELEESTLRDKEEIRSLKARLTEVTQETLAIKSEMEKLRKDGRQQKGLLAISKKQVTTAESDHTKAQADLDDALHASAPSAAPMGQRTISQSSAVMSESSVRSNNPFDRFITSISPQATESASPSQHTGPFESTARPAEPTFDIPARSSPSLTDNRAIADKSSSDTNTAASLAPTTGFDDDFGSNFVAGPAKPILNSGFDDEFAEFDKVGDVPQELTQTTESPHSAHPVSDARPEVDTSESEDETEGPEDLDKPRQFGSPARENRALPSSTSNGSSPVSKPPSPTRSSQTQDTISSANMTPVIAPAAAHSISGTHSDGLNFESDFVDLAPAITTSSEGPPLSPVATNVSKPIDKFEDDFSMDDFGASLDDAFGKTPLNTEGSSKMKASLAIPSQIDDSFSADPVVPTESVVVVTPTTPAEPNDPPAIHEMTSMGFGRSEVLKALQASGNDRERALNALLDTKEGH